MVDAIDAGLVNPASTTYGEEDARNAISAGKAAFTINWAYMYDLANNPDESTVARPDRHGPDARLPEGQGRRHRVSSSNNGSMGFAVAAGSDERGGRLRRSSTYLTSKDVQKRYAAHVTPLWTSLASDPELLAAQPVLLDMFAKQWPTAHVRPKVPYYLEMSQALQVALQEALVGARPRRRPSTAPSAWPTSWPPSRSRA